MMIELFINSMLSWSSLAWDSMGVSGIRRGKSKLSTRNPSVFQHPSTRCEHFLKSLHPFRFFIDQARYLTKSWPPPAPHAPWPFPRTRGFPQVPVASTSSPKKALRRGPRSQGGRPRLRPHGGRGGQAAPGAGGVAGVRALDGSEVRGFQGVLMSKWSNMIKHQGSLIGIWWVNDKHCGFNGMLNRIKDQNVILIYFNGIWMDFNWFNGIWMDFNGLQWDLNGI